MNNGDSGLFDGTAGKVISELKDKLRETEDKAKYWQDKYDTVLHRQIELEKQLEELGKEACALKTQLDEEIRMNKIPYGFIEQAAHDIALEVLKRKWKSKEFSVDNDVSSMDCYIASFKYAVKQLSEKLV